MKKLTTLFIVSFTIIALIGCGDGSGEKGNDSIGEHAADGIGLLGADRYYRAVSSRLDIDIDFLQFYLFIHRNELHLFLREVDESTLNTYIHLLAMEPDGSKVREIYRTVLDENVDFFNIFGFKKHADGYVSLVTTDNMIEPPYTRVDFFDSLWHFDIAYTYVYRRISPYGEVVSKLGIDSLNNEERQITITDIAFDLDGSAVASVSSLPADFDLSTVGWVIPEDIGSRSLFLFESGITGSFSEVEDETLSTGLFMRTNEGKIVIPSFAMSPMTDTITLYEIDFENGAITEGPAIESGSLIGSIGGVFSAPEISVFDLYVIGNGWELFGYIKSDGTFTPLIDFLELGVPLNHWGLDRNSFLLWDDGRITIADITWNASSRRDEITLYLLTPSAEPFSDASEREIITLGGINIVGSPLMEQVTVFNRQSDTHRIEVVNYAHTDIDRLRTELIAGRGPDMFKLSWWGIFLFHALSEGHFMLDLYEMIDADPDLSRDNFFPSVLSSWENSRGELVKIAPDFGIQTIIGMQSSFPEAPENWNYADFMAFYQEAREAGYDYPMGQAIDRFLILDKLLYADNTFFCERSAVANFDSESFINVLNFLMTIPEDQGWDRVSHIESEGLWDPIGDLIRGQQLLLPFANISDFLDFYTLQGRLGGISAFGFPSNEAPVHAVQVGSGRAVGIRSNSPHIEAAWDFVRLGLLPELSHGILNFPLRIDLFEQLILDELNRTEPRGTAWAGGFLEMPPMTESDANLLLELVSNIGHTPMTEHPVKNIVNEDVAAFFAGTRSAEDTARIIQSRVQIFLAERER